MGDREIKTWDNRLKDQAESRYDNYVHRRIDLSIARDDVILLIPGEYIYVEDVSDVDIAVAKIKIQKNNNDALDLSLGVEIYTVFTQVFITNAVLQGAWMDVIFGINFIYRKPMRYMIIPT